MRRSTNGMARLAFAVIGLCLSAMPAFAGTTPYRVQADTVSDSSVTISWVTTTAETGYVSYGTSSGSLTSVAYDSRGSSTSSDVHHVVISGLSASTTYYWKIVSGGTEYDDGAGNAYQTTTGSSLILLGSRFVTGQVLDANGGAAADALVHVTLRNADGSGSSGDSQTKTVLADSSGNWLFLLESFRTADLSGGFSASTSGDSILVTADGAGLGVGTNVADSSYASSSPTTITTTLVEPGVPVVSAVSPSQGTNSVTTDLTLTGSDFLFATSAALDDGAATTLGSFTVVSDSVITATVPSGVATGTYNVRVAAPAGTNSTSAETFTATAPPSITETTLAGWTSGVAYSHAIGVSGGAAPVTWSVISGSLPAGLSLSSAGVLAGTPTGSGTASFTVRVTDHSGVTASQAFTLTIAAAVSTPSGSLGDWTLGRSYPTSTLSTTGGTDAVSMTVTGLPTGLSASGTGRSRDVAGTPTVTGTYTVTVSATDAVGSTASRTYTVVIHDVLSIPAGTLPDWTAGQSYGSRDVTTSGGTGSVTWTATGLPPGITAAPSGRTLTFAGTPTTPGTYAIATTVTDIAGSSAARTFSVTISAALTQPSATLPDWTLGRDYGSRAVTTTDGTSPISWTVSGLPPGLVSSASGRTVTLTGTPTAAGTYSIVATTTDAAGSTASRTFAVTINAPLTQPTGTLPNWTAGIAFGSRTVTTTGGTDTVSWTTTGVPPGLAATGSGRTLTVSGTPTTPGSYSLNATATDAAGASVSQTFAIVVAAAMTTPAGTLPDWTQGRDYGTRTITTTGGTDAISWSVTGLPPGIVSTSSGRTLTVVGTPNQAGSFGVTITATDSVGSSAVSNRTIVIGAPVTTPSGALPDWTVGQAWGSRVLSTTGGTDPVTWTVMGLPPGTSSSASGRSLTVSGTPTTAGTFSVGVTATDGAGSTASRTIPVVINAPLTALAGALPDWTVGRNYGTRTITTSGGTDPVTWTVANLPSGLVSSGSGRTLSVSGFPDTAATYSVTLTATDAAGATASRVVSIVINPSLSSPAGSLPDWTVGRDYGSRTMTTTGGTDPIDWSVTGLPPGLAAAANGRTATITGTPTTAGSYSVVATVSDGTGNFSTRALTIVVAAPVTAAAGTLPDWTQGRPYGTRTLTTTGGTDSISWTVTGLPTGLTASASARVLTVTGTPTATGTFSAVVTVTDAAGSSAARTIPVVVSAPVTQPTGALPDWTIARDYGTRTLTTSGGTTPMSWTVTGLPPGLFATPNDRTLTVVGTPSQTGTFNVSATVTDAAGSTATAAVSITINAALSAPAGTLPDWTIGRSYGTRSVTTTGGTSPIGWTVSGLPAGLLTTASGRTLDVSGTPTAAGTYSVTMTATDAAGATAARTFSIVVNAAVTTPTGALPDWTIGRDYGTRTLVTTGGTEALTWSVGGLPPGLAATPNGRSVAVTGVPTTPGSYTVSVSVTDAAGSNAAASFPVTVNAALTSATGTLPDWTVGRDYTSRALTVTGGTAPITWSVSGLPTGLTGAAQGRTYTITGTPTAAGSFIVLASVSDPAGSTSTAAWPVTIHPALGAATGSLPDWTVGFAYGIHELSVSGGTAPVNWTVTGLPPGLTGSQSPAPGRTYTVSGTPTAVGRYTVSVTLTDAAGATSGVSIPVVVNDVVTIADSELPSWTIGRPLTHTMTAVNGTPALRWELVSGLPPGLRFSPSTATFSGTPTQEGDFPVAFRVTDVAGSSDERSYTMRINGAVGIATDRLLFASEHAAYADAIVTSDGTAPFAWSVTSGALPAWLLLDPNTGALTGTPDAAGFHDFDVTVTDAAGATAVHSYRLEVAAVLAFDGTVPVLPVASNQQRLLVAVDGLRSSVVTMKFRRPDGVLLTAAPRLLRADGTDWLVAAKKGLKAAVGRKGATLATPPLVTSDRYYVSLDGATGSAFDVEVTPGVRYGSKFSGTLEIAAGGSGLVQFAAPAGANVTITIQRGTRIQFVGRTNAQTSQFVNLGNVFGPKLPIVDLESWGDHDVECANADGTAVTLRYSVTVSPKKVPKKSR